MSENSPRLETDKVKSYDLDEAMRRRIDHLAAWLREADTKLPRDFRTRYHIHGQEHDELRTTIASLLRGVLSAPPDVLDLIVTIGVFVNLPSAEQHNLVRPFIQPDRPPPTVNGRGEVEL